jgi:hypothetical protein
LKARIENFDIVNFRQMVARNISDASVRDAIDILFHFAEDKADRIKGGQSEYGSFHYQIDIVNRTLTLFTVDGSGEVSVSLGNFVRRPPIVSGRAISNLRSTLAQIPGFDSFSKDYPDRPGFTIAKTVVNPDVMIRFKTAICRFQEDAQEHWETQK